MRALVLDRLAALAERRIMLTFDQRLTAEVIGQRLGLLDESQHAIDGREVDRSSPEEVGAATAPVAAFSSYRARGQAAHHSGAQGRAGRSSRRCALVPAVIGQSVYVARDAAARGRR